MEGHFIESLIDRLCLQFIYMQIIRAHVQNFVEIHNTHKIRKQPLRDHYLPTGKPFVLYNGIGSSEVNKVNDFAVKPDHSVLNTLEKETLGYDLDEYLTDQTKGTFSKILKEGGFQTSFQYHENHREAYIYLRTTLRNLLEDDPEFGKHVGCIPDAISISAWEKEIEIQELSSLRNLDSLIGNRGDGHLEDEIAKNIDEDLALPESDADSDEEYLNI
ncbi:hypothetical protein BJ508DRAFT_327524 [Ascobolus immersus RN42]|uniref:Uncharacterized protein n=1 Tax=Ascobolus immersus RN42 TaxID=1160509 RepID=A0A3N4I7Q9_ASCIM|nr:hypothetical protein BJ508DRAFT_327524 [Ascobolus immersus RN42]